MLSAKSGALTLDNFRGLSEVVTIFVRVSAAEALLCAFAHHYYLVDLLVWCWQGVWNSARLHCRQQGLFDGKLWTSHTMHKRSSGAVPINNRMLPCAGVGLILEADIDREVITPMSVEVFLPGRSQEAVESDIFHRRVLRRLGEGGSA